MKYYIVSDIHSCYDKLLEGLEKAGFEANNENHILIVNGDIFDRGDKPLELYQYLKNLKNKIMIQGNHELLFKELLEAKFPGTHDVHNGTLDTFCQIAGVPIGTLDSLATGWATFEEKDLWKKVQEKVRKSEIAEWICNKENWVDYVEIDKFIITHAFLPTVLSPMIDETSKMVYMFYPPYHVPAKYQTLFTNWREETSPLCWDDAKWLDAPDLYIHGVFKPEADKGKVLIVGHKWCNYFHKIIGHTEPEHDSDIYYDDHLIAIDGRVFVTGVMNILVIDENFNVWDKNQTQIM